MAGSDPPSTERPSGGGEIPTPIPLAVHVERRIAPVRDDCERVMLCKMCKSPVQLLSATTQHPEAPEMVRLLTPDAWLGLVSNDAPPDGTRDVSVNGEPHVDLVIVCSKKCLDKLLAE